MNSRPSASSPATFLGLLTAFAVVLCAFAPKAIAASVAYSGKLVVPPGTQIVVVATDPVVQQVVAQDLVLAQHEKKSHEKSDSVLTLTIFVNQASLRPGVSMAELAPGNPAVAHLLAKLGATPPPLGDTGLRPQDPYAEMLRQQSLAPDNSPIEQLKREQAISQSMRWGGPGATGSASQHSSDLYDRVVIARATLGNDTTGFTAVAIVHPGEPPRTAQELVAEEIADAILH